jgi:hypothetical protein
MAERRRVAKRASIIIELDDGITLEAKPLQWMDRNDLGNEIVEQFIEVTNLQIKAYTDPEGVPQMQAYAQDKLKDPLKILRMGYPGEEESKYSHRTWGGILELILASMDVNGLSHIRNLVDPNFQAPVPDGGKNDSGQNEESETPKTPSMQGSDSPALTESELSTSPTQNSQQ